MPIHHAERDVCWKSETIDPVGCGNFISIKIIFHSRIFIFYICVTFSQCLYFFSQCLGHAVIHAEDPQICNEIGTILFAEDSPQQDAGARFIFMEP
jgi:hypothetical protein